MTSNAPLDLRDVFSTPWSGTATMSRPWWLRWLPVPSTFEFHTEITDVDLAETTGLLVCDTTTFPNGKVWKRTMRARLVAPGHWKISARDMPGGADQHVTSEGFSFSPYIILAPVIGPLRVPLRCHDEVRLVDESTLTDRIEMRFCGIRVGQLTMTLQRL